MTLHTFVCKNCQESIDAMVDIDRRTRQVRVEVETDCECSPMEDIEAAVARRAVKMIGQ